MIKKCLGCGIELQNSNVLAVGYVKDEKKDLCERCFRIQNYNEYKTVSKNNEEFINILKDINNTNDLVLLLIDIFNLPSNLDVIKKHLSNDLVLIITKYDLLKPYLKEEKLKKYIRNIGINSVSTLIISSYKNYNFDLLLDTINKHKKSNNVYVVGKTNVGKSTMINKLIYNYTNSKSQITTSKLPSTTLGNIVIKLNNNLTIIDTPGLLEKGNIIDAVELKKIFKIIPTSVIKPRTFQIKKPQTIIIEDLAKLYFFDKNDITMYISSKLEVKRVYKEDDADSLIKRVIKVPAYHDLVIKGLGFIKIIKETTINIYLIDNVDIYIRESLI
ncbi:MAG: 50S ribosome-binding GTPase [Bacilli bacterium]|nr:50S ribosome-binding GTPase [Bacilli bacterium]MDD4282459.1 50S ribosome-binding GTPase [Bacilli bacterium]MDD4718944.1 50S ribosome-binding GTPase [Bacilli bacterium]